MTANMFSQLTAAYKDNLDPDSVINNVLFFSVVTHLWFIISPVTNPVTVGNVEQVGLRRRLQSVCLWKHFLKFQNFKWNEVGK